MNQLVNKNKDNNKNNSSNSLVFGRWPQAKTSLALRSESDSKCVLKPVLFRMFLTPPKITLNLFLARKLQ